MEATGFDDQKKEEAWMQFLTMTEGRVDPDVARQILEVANYNVQAAVEQLYGGEPGQSRPATGAPMGPAAMGPAAMGPAAMSPHGGVDDEDAALAAALAASAEQAGGGAPQRPEALTPANPASMSVDEEEDAHMEDRQRGAPFAPHTFDGVDDQEAADAHLAAVIEASYRDQTASGRAASEEELVAQAMKISQQEEDSRQRKALRESQEAELAESILMDRMREEQAQERRRQEEEQARAIEASRLEEEQRQQEEAQRAAQELEAEREAKRARLPAEPPAGEPGRVAVLVRLPGGKRLQRAFRSSDAVAVLYDFVDLESAEVAGQRYRLVQTMPRKAFEDRQQSLEEAGVQNQCALMVESSAAGL